MQEAISTLTGKVRKALDDLAPSLPNDSFTSDANDEIAQALLQAAEIVVMEAPVMMLEPTIKTTPGTGTDDVSIAHDNDGSGILTLPASAIRIVEFQMTCWPGVLREFLDPASDEAKMQRTSWGCGSIEKPKAVVTHNTASGKIDIHYWKADSNHDLEYVAFVEKPKVTTVNDALTLNCAAKSILEKNIIFQACRIFLEGKKESALAEKFAALAQI